MIEYENEYERIEQDNESLAEIARLRAENERLRTGLTLAKDALERNTGNYSFVLQAIADALSVEKKASAIEPHDYFPSAMHMGDCGICGHTQNAPIHKRSVEQSVAYTDSGEP